MPPTEYATTVADELACDSETRNLPFVGVLASWASARLVSSFLFGVSATDPAIYAIGVGLILLFVLLASAMPAVRAASANPVKALRAV